MTDKTDSNIDTLAAFTDNSVLLDYSLDETDAATKLFDCYTNVEKVTSEFGQEEYEGVKDRRKKFVEDVKDLVKNDTDPIEIDPDSFEYLRGNDISYGEELLGELMNNVEADKLVQRLNEEEDKINVGYQFLFKDPRPSVKTVEIKSTDNHDELDRSLCKIVQNSNDRCLLCDATEWHKNGGTGVFLSTDKDDIAGYEEEKQESSEPDESKGFELSDTLMEFAATEETQPEKINNRIELVYSSDLTLNIFTTSSFINLLEKGEPAVSET